MRSSLWLILSLLAPAASAAVACTSSDPPAQLPAADASIGDVSTAEGSVPDGMSPPSGSDSGPSDGGASLTDGPSDDGGQDFCKSAAAAGAAFCADFEQSTAVDDGWNDLTTAGGATMTLETTIAKQKKSALARFISGDGGSANGVAAFSTVVNAAGAKSKMAIEFDARVSFPNGPPSTNTLFLTIALRTGTSPSGHYFIDIERGSGGWELLATGTSGEPFPAVGEDFWHHFRLSYDGSGAQGEINLFIDNLGVASILRTKGPPPGGAPATFDNVLIEHLGLEADKSTSFYIDNVVVTYP